MLNVKELESVEALEAVSVAGDGCCRIPLLHGTRRYALEISDAERREFYDACRRVMVFAQKLSGSGKIENGRLEAYQKKNPRFMSYAAMRCGSKSFEYGDFYLTSSYSCALSFAHNAGGELGEFAYHHCVGFRDLGIAPDADTAAAADVVEKEYPKYRNSEKIVLIYLGVQYSDLQNENGTPFLTSDESTMRSRMKLLAMSIDRDGSQINLNFRLAAPGDYTAWALREKDLRAGFRALTAISDVDGHIKSRGWDV